jgi:lipid II:glycine glycyltransferase (peptidoglycan interpeptide bridge formation enzyme)
MGSHTVKIEPEVLEKQKDTKDLLGEIGFQKARYDLNKTTMIVDLNPPEEELLTRMKGKTRYNVRLATRKGVGVEETGFEEAWDTFYGLLMGTAERNGFVIRRSREYLHDSMRAM